MCQWMADYYAAPLGLVLRAALPAPLASPRRPAPTGREQRVVVLTQVLDSLLERERLFRRAPRQRAAYELLEARGGAIPLQQARAIDPALAAAFSGLVRRGLARWEVEQIFRDPLANRPAHPATQHQPTGAQLAAIQAIATAQPGEAFLLYGVTGSGKTLVYLEALRSIVERRQRSAIVLVPEIALTPQTVDRFRAAFGDSVAVLHSALSDGERLDAWRAMREGRKRIVVGARSAIFAPLENVGLIVLDEEQEPSYKQGETPRYHAREAALVRGRKEGAVVVLGSATPSLESWQRASRGSLRLLRLPDRVGGGTLPSVSVVDLRSSQSRDVGGSTSIRRVFSEELEAALEVVLRRGEQALLLLNRRGYATFLQCLACGDVMTCPQCSISLTLHRAPARLVCHYCDHREAVPERCRRCGALTTRERGVGTQQLERLLAERFPQARIARMDLDTTAGKWGHARILDRFAQGEIDVLVGTQMIAKGLDFPGVTLVGVIDADVGINLPDFRAGERAFQLMAQVAGRAGRGAKPGRVIIQTRLPDHHAVRCAVEHDYETFAVRELAERVMPPYPPTVSLANVLVSGTDPDQVVAVAEQAAQWLRRLSQRHGNAQVTGPALSPVQRIKGRWRWHLLVRSARARELTALVRYFAERFPRPGGDVRITVDRDPVSLL
jgi:primosomal protein N' (replication factor Y)